MLRKFLSLSAAAALIALLGTAWTDEPASAFQSTCGGHSGPECTTTTTEACVNLLLWKWCSTFKTVTYYELAAPGDLES